MSSENPAASSRHLELGEAPVKKLILKYSVPAITGMLVQALYNIADRFFLGNGVGSDAIAGVTLGFPVMLVMMAFGMLIGIGGSSVFSIKMGQGDTHSASKALGNAALLVSIISLVIMVAGLVFLEPLLEKFGSNEKLMPYASSYLRIILYGAVLNGLGFGLSNFIRADGSPQFAMITMLAGALTNIALDPIFIFGFNMGVEGAAWATIISQAVSAALIIYYFSSKRAHVHFEAQSFKLSGKICGQIIAIGMSPFLMQLAASLYTGILNSQLSRFGGNEAIALLGIINSISMLFLMPVFGLVQGLAPIIGYNHGAKKYHRSLESARLGIIYASIIVVFASVLNELFPRQLVYLFNQEEKILELASWASRIIFISFSFVGFQVVASSYFQSIGKARESMFLNLSRQVIFLIPLMLIIPEIFLKLGLNGLAGVAWTIPISDALSVILTFILFNKEKLHVEKLMKQQENEGSPQADLSLSNETSV